VWIAEQLDPEQWRTSTDLRLRPPSGSVTAANCRPTAARLGDDLGAMFAATTASTVAGGQTHVPLVHRHGVQI
jgi:hypothetical protein